MARKDIIAGLKNAIERGHSLEDAKHSFIAAGYNREDIEEAATFVSSGSSLVQREEKPLVKPVMSVQPAKKVKLPKQNVQKIFGKESLIDKVRKNSKVILLAIILALLIIVFILTFLFRGKILNLFT